MLYLYLEIRTTENSLNDGVENMYTSEISKTAAWVTFKIKVEDEIQTYQFFNSVGSLPNELGDVIISFIRISKKEDVVKRFSNMKISDRGYEIEVLNILCYLNGYTFDDMKTDNLDEDQIEDMYSDFHALKYGKAIQKYSYPFSENDPSFHDDINFLYIIDFENEKLVVGDIDHCKERDTRWTEYSFEKLKYFNF